jgi:hypothetical protein
MKPYIFLALGAIWLVAVIVAVVWGSFSIAIMDGHDPARVLALLRVLIPLFLLGWIAPILFGSWLLWKSKHSN